MASLQAGSPGTQACINAGNSVSDIIGDLDNTIMLATTGALHSKSENESFSDHRENILKAAKALIEDTKCLIAGAASSQEKLVVAAQNVVATFNQLTEVVKYAAASLGSSNPDTQVLLISSLKNVATALGDLVPSTKAAFGKSVGDPEMSNLKGSAQTMITNVRLLLQNVRSVADEHSKGTHDSESTTETTEQEQMKTGYVEVLRLEKELELAREKLAAIRRAKYEMKSQEEHHSNDSQ